MKNIFFYSNIKLNDGTIGITKKVLSQIKALRSMGYSVYYSCYYNDGVAILDNNDEVIKYNKYPINNKKIMRVIRRWILIRFATKFVKNTKVEFDYGYLRFHFFDRSYLNLLKILKNKNVVNIVEAHAYPYTTGKLSAKTPIYIVDKIYTIFVRKYIDVVAAISDEPNIWGIKTVNIDNAIDLTAIGIRKKNINIDGNIRMFSVANETPFHGYDKIIRGLSNYYKNNGERAITINFVGEYLSETKKLVKKLDLEKSVNFYGKLFGDELDEVYNNSDIGIGAFSHRKNETTGSCIKTKEYFAKGIPFINGWKEPAFDDSYKYVKRFDTKIDYIDFNEMIQFYDTIKDDEKMSNNMREFAKKNYTWQEQFNEVFKNIK